MTQQAKILEALKRGQKISPITAFVQFDCLRLSGQIFALKRKGYDIRTEIGKGANGKRWAVYHLVTNDNK